MRILMIDIGGSTVKLKLSGRDEMEKFASGRRLTPNRFLANVRTLSRGWEFDAVSVGFPGVIISGRIAREPMNLGAGWTDFHFGKAFACPVRLINDAALQALATYDSGRLLFLTLGTSLGSTLIADDVIIPLELGGLRLTKRRSIAALVGKTGLRRLGRKKWESAVWESVDLLRNAFHPDKVRIGGGNAELLKNLPPDCAVRTNRHAIRGALRLWPGLADFHAEPEGSVWKIVRPPTQNPVSATRPF